jgi:hypothetical protein
VPLCAEAIFEDYITSTNLNISRRAKGAGWILRKQCQRGPQFFKHQFRGQH